MGGKECSLFCSEKYRHRSGSSCLLLKSCILNKLASASQSLISYHIIKCFLWAILGGKQLEKVVFSFIFELLAFTKVNKISGH